jgi:cytoskeletal protein CcmA (bactofilin family)
MGATYTRQSSSAIVDGGIIEAADINAEFNQILAAFAVSSGHTHDGTAAEGGPITKLLGTAITIGDATAGTDIAVTFDGETADGVLTWMEDEDYFQFSDDLLLTTTEKLQFRDTAIYINSSADGQLDLVADTEIQIAATTIDINGAVALNGAITGATNITLSGELDAATLDISGNADIDGTLEADAITINGTAIGSIYSVVAGSSSIVTTGALDSGSITSGFGTIDTGSSTITTTGLITGGSLDIDNVLINGTTIGHTDDTDLMTLSSGVLTVAGEVDAVSLDISGDADIDGTLEADAITINGTTLAETIADTVGAMVSSNTESNITVTYDDADNTLDFSVSSSLDTTGNAATATALETARTIHGVSFDGTANIDLSEVISDTVGAMVSSNTETGITVTYQDADNTIDFAIGSQAIVNSMLADDAVGADELAANAVVTASIVDDNVTQAKIADDAVGADQLASDAVVNASIASGAAIADSKLATISTAGKVALTALEIDGGTDIGADLSTSDLIVVDDGAGGTNRKAALSRIVTLMSAQGFVTDDPTALAIALG